MDRAEPKPSVIASHVDIVYRVFAKAGGPGGWRSGNRRGVREVHAVKDVSFVANHGESIGVVGRNGSGKSTLLRAVAGLVPPTRGEVWADGTPSLLGVNAVLVRQLSGARNIYLGAQALGLTKAQVDEVYDDIVDFSGIGDAIHLPMSTYSSGMAARLRFAISTAATPPVLVIDEALATGDAHFRARSQERIEELRSKAGTVFLVSHSASTIRQMCDRAMWLEQGELLLDGPVDDVVQAYSEAAERSLGSGGPPEPDVPGVERWTGASRYQVSARASRNAVTGSRDTVLLAHGGELALAVSAVPAATTLGAPMLLSAPKRLMPVTKDELGRLEARRAVLLGGTGLLGDTLAEAVTETGAAVERVPGEDVVAVSLALHAELTAADGVETVYVAPSDDPAGALVATLTARDGNARVLLVDPSGPTPEHGEVLDRIAPRKVVVVAEADVVGDEVVQALARHAADGAGRLTAGTTVQAAAEAAQVFSPQQVGVVYVASADESAFTDSVPGAAVAVLTGAPLLLVERDEVPAATHTELERLGPSHVVVLGGPMAVSSAVRQTLAGYLRPDTPRSDESEAGL